jgi:hypothetical protein
MARRHLDLRVRVREIKWLHLNGSPPVTRDYIRSSRPCGLNTLPTGLLYPHQADGVSFLISKGRAILGMTWVWVKPARRSSECRSQPQPEWSSLSAPPRSSSTGGETHFIKNNSQRTSHCLKLLGVSSDAAPPKEG